MSFLKEILNELCSMQNVSPKDSLPLVWSKNIVNVVGIAARKEEKYQRGLSHVRNDQMPSDDEDKMYAHEINDYGDIRGGDDNEMRGYDGYSDGPQDSYGEYEEVKTQDCHECRGKGTNDWGEGCVRCGGVGKLDMDDNYVGFDDDEEDPSRKAQQALNNQTKDEEWEDNDDIWGFPSHHDRLDSGDCPDCDGDGISLGHKCKSCKGTGKVRSEEQEDAGEQGPVGTDLETAPADEISDEQIDDQYGEADPDGKNEFSDDVEKEWDDPNLQGVIRTVPNSHLIYKRQQEDGTFNELWQYNIGNDFRKELEVRRSILAGTDIPPNKMSSPDNTQSFELWTAGNAQVMNIRGLPN